MGQLLRWVMATLTQRYYAQYHTSGEGHLYEARFKSFSLEDDEHFLPAGPAGSAAKCPRKQSILAICDQDIE
jgi:hypothetical protein